MQLPNIHVIFNPAAANQRAKKQWPSIRQLLTDELGDTWTYSKTERAWHAPELVRQAIKNGARLILCIGGDGTVNEVVNGFFQQHQLLEPDVSMALIPFGTGGDFRKTISVENDVKNALLQIKQGKPHPLDVGLMEYGADFKQSRYFINIASAGVSGLIVNKVNTASKAFGGRLSFLVGTLKGLVGYKHVDIDIELDHKKIPTNKYTVIAVANGQYFGGGMRVAPQADPTDGVFDVVWVNELGLFSFLFRAPRLYKGTHVKTKGVHVERATHVVLTSAEGVPVEADGENICSLPIRISCLKQAVSLWY